MGREVRRVPPDWQHPRDATGRPIPLLAADFAAASAAWDCGQAKWERGMVATHSTLPGAPAWRPRDQHIRALGYREHAGPRPRAEAYMPAWPTERRTAWQMYETTTAGTPISPACASPEALALWLAGHDAEAGPGITASVEEWLAMIRGPGKSGLFILDRGAPASALKLPSVPLYVRVMRRFRRPPAYD